MKNQQKISYIAIPVAWLSFVAGHYMGFDQGREIGRDEMKQAVIRQLDQSSQVAKQNLEYFAQKGFLKRDSFTENPVYILDSTKRNLEGTGNDRIVESQYK